MKRLSMLKPNGSITASMNNAKDPEDSFSGGGMSASFAHENEEFKDEETCDSTGETTKRFSPEQAQPERESVADSESVSTSSGFNDSDSDRKGKQDDEDEELMTPKIAAKEARAVWASKVLVAFVLALSAGVLAFFSYTYTRGAEDKEFQAKFANYADEIRRSSIKNADNAFTVLRSFSRTITSLGNFANATFPFLTLPDFEVRAHDFQTISHADDIAFAPIVNDQDREDWEQYSVDNQAWIQQGLDYEFMVSRLNQAQLQDEDQQLLQLTTAKDQTIAPGTNMEGFSNVNKAKRIQGFIWNYAPLTHRAVPELNKGPHVPIWQTYPAPRNSYVVNHNLRSEPVFEQLILTSINNLTAVLSDVVDNFALFGRSQTISLDPKSIVLEPVVSSVQPGPKKILGFLIIIKKWGIYFEDVLYKGARPVFCVLRNSCGKAFTYKITGPRVDFLGEGDLHDTDYNHMEVVERFDHPRVTSTCNFTIHLFPTKEMEAAHKTNMPIYVTVVVMLVFVFTSLVFLLYDFFVSKRQKTTMASANATNRIVSNLFPKAVRDRLIQEMEAQDADNNSTASLNSGHFSNPGARRKDKRGSATFINLSMNGSNHSAKGNNGKGKDTFGTSEDIFGSKPIAELFPATTIMFADMVGFTAWSSVREPTQVFTLLETIYHSFDSIAKRRRVFKVETIGDCYVAVAGLPMPRKDHAQVMARFSSECLSKMDLLVKNLEASLGPDTGDLSLRIGLHSGPVTAGVLRGEKGRFQLFGDTMNTASRMESTGMRGRIQVSSDTAALLKAAGKDKWVTERSEMVHAKGKGELQTFWLQIRSGSDNDTASAVGANDDLQNSLRFDEPGNDSGPRLMKQGSCRLANPEANSLMRNMATAAKSRRLIEWNTDILGKLLKQIVLRRVSRRIKKKQLGLLGVGVTVSSAPAPPADTSFEMIAPSGHPIDEVKDIISLPHYDPKAFAKNVDPNSVEIPEVVLIQLNVYVSRIADLYRDNPFHNFEHASHVTMSVTKLMSRIINPLQVEGHAGEQNKMLHDHTFGITSDPLTQFACVLSALIHDADHPGVSNSVLVDEKDPLALKYQEKSVAEQNSVDLAWDILMEDQFDELRSLIYTNQDEFDRFRQILVNIVLATDIMDKSLGAQRKARWEKAFNSTTNDLSGSATFRNDEISEVSADHAAQCDVNRKATIVLEHLIQASDVSHTMQHWHVYLKWNERLFCEVYKSYLAGRIQNDPSVGWYKGEIGFFDFYIIPLARKLETCGVFGVSSMEYLSYAEANRREWERKGEGIVKGYLEKFDKDKA